jgi:hypothetical protein
MLTAFVPSKAVIFIGLPLAGKQEFLLLGIKKYIKKIINPG